MSTEIKMEPRDPACFKAFIHDAILNHKKIVYLIVNSDSVKRIVKSGLKKPLSTSVDAAVDASYFHAWHPLDATIASNSIVAYRSIGGVLNLFCLDGGWPSARDVREGSLLALAVKETSISKIYGDLAVISQNVSRDNIFVIEKKLPIANRHGREMTAAFERIYKQLLRVYVISHELKASTTWLADIILNPTTPFDTPDDWVI